MFQNILYYLHCQHHFLKPCTHIFLLANVLFSITEKKKKGGVEGEIIDSSFLVTSQME